MKFFFLISFLLGASAKAELIDFSCEKKVYSCIEDLCSWKNGPTQVFTFDIYKAISGPNHETWEDSKNLALDGQKFRLTISQFRTPIKRVNELTVILDLDKDTRIAAVGNEKASAVYVKQEVGVRVTCNQITSPMP